MPQSVRNLYSSLRGFFDQSGFPPVFGDFPSTSIVPVPAPPADLSPAGQAEVNRARKSVFKIYGQAPECDRGIEGSGFVYAPHHILTNAHVVAGTRRVQIQLDSGQGLPATVVFIDPSRDVAVLSVPGLNAPVLPWARAVAKTGSAALVLGYPENGPFTVRTARVRSLATVGGTDIYGHGSVHRSIYSIRSIVRSGNSGGPLLTYGGGVLGMVFATATDSPDTGFALSQEEIRAEAEQGRTRTAGVSTGGCTPD
jgi:S1-C subfamily serine protease